MAQAIGLHGLHGVQGICDLCGLECSPEQQELNALDCTYEQCGPGVYHQDCLEKYLKMQKMEKSRKAGFRCPRGTSRSSPQPRCPGRITKSHPIHPRNDGPNKKRKSVVANVNEVQNNTVEIEEKILNRKDEEMKRCIENVDQDEKLVVLSKEPLTRKNSLSIGNYESESKKKSKGQQQVGRSAGVNLRVNVIRRDPENGLRTDQRSLLTKKQQFGISESEESVLDTEGQETQLRGYASVAASLVEQPASKSEVVDQGGASTPVYGSASAPTPNPIPPPLHSLKDFPAIGPKPAATQPRGIKQSLQLVGCTPKQQPALRTVKPRPLDNSKVVGVVKLASSSREAQQENVLSRRSSSSSLLSTTPNPSPSPTPSFCADCQETQIYCCQVQNERSSSKASQYQTSPTLFQGFTQKLEAGCGGCSQPQLIISNYLSPQSSLKALTREASTQTGQQDSNLQSRSQFTSRQLFQILEASQNTLDEDLTEEELYQRCLKSIVNERLKVAYDGLLWLGFSRYQASMAIEKFGGNLSASLTWLLNRSLAESLLIEVPFPSMNLSNEVTQLNRAIDQIVQLNSSSSVLYRHLYRCVIENKGNVTLGIEKFLATNLVQETSSDKGGSESLISPCHSDASFRSPLEIGPNGMEGAVSEDTLDEFTDFICSRDESVDQEDNSSGISESRWLKFINQPRFPHCQKLNVQKEKNCNSLNREAVSQACGSGSESQASELQQQTVCQLYNLPESLFDDGDVLGSYYSQQQFVSS